MPAETQTPTSLLTARYYLDACFLLCCSELPAPFGSDEFTCLKDRSGCYHSLLLLSNPNPLLFLTVTLTSTVSSVPAPISLSVSRKARRRFLHVKKESTFVQVPGRLKATAPRQRETVYHISAAVSIP